MMKGQAMVGMRRSSSCRTEVTGTSADLFPPSTTCGLGSFLRVQLYTSSLVVKQQVAAEHSEFLKRLVAKNLYECKSFSSSLQSWCYYWSVEIKTTIPVAEGVLVHLRL
jgi:hypothetical protein